VLLPNNGTILFYSITKGRASNVLTEQQGKKKCGREQMCLTDTLMGIKIKRREIDGSPRRFSHLIALLV
jgi:hypothetical protein